MYLMYFFTEQLGDNNKTPSTFCILVTLWTTSRWTLKATLT